MAITVPWPSESDDGDDVVPLKPVVRDSFAFYTDLELAAIPPLVAAIAEILFRDTLACLVAKWESYKTFVALEMAFCIAVGADYYGRRVKQGVVLYISAEGGAGLARRVAALRRKYGNFEGPIPLVILPSSVLINDEVQVASMLMSAYRKMEAMGIGADDVVAVFLDTVARNMRGDENKVEDMNAFVRGMDQIRRDTKACVVAIHHTGWEGGRSRGSTALPSALDTEILLERDDDRVLIKNTKQKDAPHFESFTLRAESMAGSMVLMPFAPTSSILSKNELAALGQVQDAPGLTSTEWEKASGLADGSYNNARRRLMSLAYVKQVKRLYVATDAGRQAFGARCNLGASEVQS